jgi:hypothetical protein
LVRVEGGEAMALPTRRRLATTNHGPSHDDHEPVVLPSCHSGIGPNILPNSSVTTVENADLSNRLTAWSESKEARPWHCQPAVDLRLPIMVQVMTTMSRLFSHLVTVE